MGVDAADKKVDTKNIELYTFKHLCPLNAELRQHVYRNEARRVEVAAVLVTAFA